jgi:hypothetical protein
MVLEPFLAPDEPLVLYTAETERGETACTPYAPLRASQRALMQL